jgi:hypothetical protein
MTWIWLLAEAKVPIKLWWMFICGKRVDISPILDRLHSVSASLMSMKEINWALHHTMELESEQENTYQSQSLKKVS